MAQIRYITSNIDELDAAEHDLEANGIPRSHIHVLSNDSFALARHDLPAYSEWSKRDIVHYGLRGAALGAVLCTLIIVGALLYGVSGTAGWVALGFVSAATMGFCVWEGGLMGIAKINHEFKAYGDAINQGQHLLVVDVDNQVEEDRARYTVESHPVMHAVQ